LPNVTDHGRELTPDIGFYDLLTTLRTHAGWHGLDHNQFSLNPKILTDSLLVHLLTADMTFSVIVMSLVIGHRYSKAYVVIVDGLFCRPLKRAINR